jgi:hypothetical protein
MGHMTLSAYNVLTVIVNLENLDKNRFEIKLTASAVLSENESNIDDDFDITGSRNKIEIVDKLKGILLGIDSIVEVKINKLSISSGNVILFGQLY